MNDILMARAFLNRPGPKNDQFVWTAGNLQALSIDGDVEAANALAAETRSALPGDELPWVAFEESEAGFLYIEQGSNGATNRWQTLPVMFSANLQSFSELLKRGEGTLPLLRKAVWLP